MSEANIVVYKKTGRGLMRLFGWGKWEKWITWEDWAYAESVGANLFALEAWEHMTEGGVQVGERNADYCFPPSWEWLRPEPNWLKLPSPIYRFRYL